MVCPWIDNSDLSRYLTKYKGLSTIDRLNIVKQVTEGLLYLHSNDVVHGDLTGKNILVGDRVRVYICDFGLSSISGGDPDNTACQTTSTITFNLRWTAPEIMISNVRPTESTDVYSLASVMLQVFTGLIPYHGKTDGWVFVYIYSGKSHPPRPADAGLIPPRLWDLMLQCWAKTSEDRPRVIAISKFLSSLKL
ncbi:kinase-like domain-containing protein [Collybia nuda]|uniref:Kinase-like domain-containing protein n=1 Tax=Collybia nuda TaxID=64659 RepID=A0A9P6CDX7_9AGAR|nr:kinase-like domain-containing protein [Collybia nuda]